MVKSSPIAILVGLLLDASLVAAAAPEPLDTARRLHVAGDWHAALEAYERVTETDGIEPAKAAIALNNSCAILNSLADYPAALDACREALRLRRTLDDEIRLARTLNNFGLTLQRLGRFDEADLSYREALDINERQGDLEAQLINRQNLGLVANDAGRYGDALELLTGAEQLAARHGGEPWADRQSRLARLNQGVVLEKLGAYREALDLYHRLAEEKEEIDSGHWASLQVNLGVLYRNLGDPRKAVQAFEEATATYEQLGDVASLSNAKLNLALALHLNLGQLEKAEGSYRQALELARSSGDRSEEIQDLYYLGRLLLDLDRAAEAEAIFGHCLEVAESSGSAEGRWSARFGLGLTAAALEQPLRALEYLERAIDEIEQIRSKLAGGRLRSGYFGDKRPVYAASVALLAELEEAEPGAGHREHALEIVQRTKARELLESLRSPRPESRTDPASPLDTEKLIELAGRDLVLEYFLGDDLFLWAIAKDGVRMENLGPIAPIIEQVLGVHRELAAGRSPVAASLRSLAGTLFRGIETEIADASRVWIAPDGPLHYLPFEILPLPDSESQEPATLLDRAAVSYLPSASMLRRAEKRRASNITVLAGFGDPDLPSASAATESSAERFSSRFDLGPLPAASHELAAIERLLDGESEIRTGAQATEEMLRRAAARGARVVHLATHTVIGERPGQGTAILLTPADGDDGLLRPEEIAALDYRVDLTVLAGCSSALGAVEDGRAFASLTGSFLSAGSGAVIASLWDVGDQASAIFMEQFYYQLSRGRPPADALRRAKLRLRSDPAWDRPDLWAAFILIGDAPPVVTTRLPVWGLIAMLVLALVIWKTRARARH